MNEKLKKKKTEQKYGEIKTNYFPDSKQSGCLAFFYHKK